MGLRHPPVQPVEERTRTNFQRSKDDAFSVKTSGMLCVASAWQADLFRQPPRQRSTHARNGARVFRAVNTLSASSSLSRRHHTCSGNRQRWLSYAQNKTLNESPTTKVPVHLLDAVEPIKYTYADEEKFWTGARHNGARKLFGHPANPDPADSERSASFRKQWCNGLYTELAPASTLDLAVETRHRSQAD
jgi:hypothetical protein